MCARLRIKETFAAAAAHAGAKMSKKFNTESTKIKKFHDEWCLANGYKLSSRRAQVARHRIKAANVKIAGTVGQNQLKIYLMEFINDF